MAAVSVPLSPGNMGSEICLDPLNEKAEEPIQGYQTSPGPDGTRKVALNVNVDALRTAVEDALGEPVATLTFLDKGVYHKVYLATFIGRPDVVIRVARNECPRNKMSSEVAVIKYLQLHTSVPIPQVLYVCLDSSHAVGGEFMIQEKAPGVKLSSVFGCMTLTQKTELVRHLTKLVYEIYLQRFDRIGSLYESEGGAFYVGPIVTFPYFRDGRWLLDTNKGPFDTVEDYLLACLQRERVARAAQLDDTLKSRGDVTQVPLSPGQIDNMERLVREAGYNDQPPESLSMSLQDLNLGNIFVDPEEPSRIVSIVDWECIPIFPTWLAIRPPTWVLPGPPESKELYPAQREERMSLISTMLETAGILDPQFAEALSGNLTPEKRRQRNLFEEISRVEWFRAWVTVHFLKGQGFADGWPVRQFVHEEGTRAERAARRKAKGLPPPTPTKLTVDWETLLSLDGVPPT